MKKEKYITERKSTRKGHKNETVSFVLSMPYKVGNEREWYNAVFSVKDYMGDPREAFKAAKRDKKEHEYLLEGIPLRKPSTVKDMYDKVHINFSARMRTKRKHDCAFNKYIAPEFANKEIAKVTLEDVMKTLRASAKNNQQKGVECVKTVWNYIFKVALLNGAITSNWIPAVKMPRAEKLEGNRPKNISPSEWKYFLECFDNYGYYLGKNESYDYKKKMFRYSLLVCRATGIRGAEARAIHKSDIKFVKVKGIEGVVAIVDILREIGSSETEWDVERELKTKSSKRKAYLFLDDAEMLMQAMEESKHELLFADFDGKPIGTKYVTDLMYNISKKYHIPALVYTLRKALSSDLYAGDSSPVEVKYLMGHDNEGMSIDTYAGTTGKALIKAIYNRKISMMNNDSDDSFDEIVDEIVDEHKKSL